MGAAPRGVVACGRRLAVWRGTGNAVSLRTREFKSHRPRFRNTMSDLTPHERAALKANGQSLEVAFQIGKSGVTEGVVQELVARLEREPLLKVRLLKGAREDGDTKAVAQDLAERAGVVLVEVRGHTALFYRPRRGRSVRRR